MKHFHQARVLAPQYIGLAICSALLSGLVAGHTFAAEPEASASEAAAADAAARVKWRRSIERLPVPNRNSCFTAAFPKTEWQEIPCGTPPKHPFLPPQAHQPANVGGSFNDVVAEVPVQTLQISTAIGSFGSNTIALNETGPQYISDTSCTVKNPNQPNVYSLQLNTNTFPIPVGSSICGNVRGCEGFQQFVYFNYVHANGEPAEGAIIQYWLLNVGTFGKAKCPSAAWTAQNVKGKLACWQQTPGSADPGYNTSINGVQNLELAGAITGSGEQNVTLWANGVPYALPAPDILGLGQNWHNAEFNVFGFGCGQGAMFQPSPQITPTLSIVLAVDYAPTPFADGYMPLDCEKASYTLEWNNLGFSGPAQTFPAEVGNGYPTLYFTEALGASAGPSCAPPPSSPPPIVGSGGGSDQCMRNGLIVPCATCNFSNLPSPRSCTPCAGHCPLPQ